MSAASRAKEIAAQVTDPELPMVTLDELGILRDVSSVKGTIHIVITPTYSGCPAMGTMRDDLLYALERGGFANVEVEIALRPAWTTDWISTAGKEKLRAAGIAPPGPARRYEKVVPLTLNTAPPVACPRCAGRNTETISRFSGTACKALLRCRECVEPFEHFKDH